MQQYDSIIGIQSLRWGSYSMDIKQLEIFLSLSQSLHFGRTAERHALSSSALSRLVVRLEEEAGTKLFERDNRRVNLTAAGESYAAYARSTLEGWTKFKQSVIGQADSHGMQTLKGEVSLYCSVTASLSLLSPLLANWRKCYPGVDIRVHTGDQASSLQRLKQEQEEFVIAAIPDSIPSATLIKRLSSSELVFIAPKGGSIQAQIASDSLAWQDLPWVLAEKGLSRQRLDRWFRVQRIKPQIYAQVSGHEAIVSMVSLGFGVGLVPKLVLSNSPASDRITIYSAEAVLQSEPFKAFEVGLCVLKRRLASPQVNALWESVGND